MADNHEHAHVHSHSHDHIHEHSHVDENGHVYTHTHTHADGSHEHDHGHIHSAEHTRKVLNRMSRIIGHMESTKRMVEDGRDCSEVLIQLSAIESAINSVSRVILKEHPDDDIHLVIHHRGPRERRTVWAAFFCHIFTDEKILLVHALNLAYKFNKFIRY